ncbi:MAG TPA: Na/Pi symporter, partial [Pseudomonas sp.]|nr:Na/Pi symporter [Pseudomonas sp.]
MKYLRTMTLPVVTLGLVASFWLSAGWLQLCGGLAMFLFGMQCLEEGLRQLAGSKLEQVLARSTATPFKSLLFGVGGTLLLQSSTLVSLLTIAFISTGLIQLAGGIAILFGANLGATSGIWLLALAGQNLSLSPLALPLLVFGVLAGFF